MFCLIRLAVTAEKNPFTITKKDCAAMVPCSEMPVFQHDLGHDFSWSAVDQVADSATVRTHQMSYGLAHLL